MLVPVPRWRPRSTRTCTPGHVCYSSSLEPTLCSHCKQVAYLVLKYINTTYLHKYVVGCCFSRCPFIYPPRCFYQPPTTDHIAHFQTQPWVKTYYCCCRHMPHRNVYEVLYNITLRTASWDFEPRTHAVPIVQCMHVCALLLYCQIMSSVPTTCSRCKAGTIRPTHPTEPSSTPWRFYTH